MRRLTLCSSIEDDEDERTRSVLRPISSGSEYMSLADLPPPALPLGVPTREPSFRFLAPNAVRDDQDEYELNSTDKIRIRRLQDVLLGSIVGISIALVCLACNQLYNGNVCTTTRLGVEGDPVCSPLNVEDIGGYGAPDLVLHAEEDQKLVEFHGGWTVLHSTLHALVPLLLVVCVAFFRTTSPTTYRHYVWLWFVCAEAIVLFIDAITLREWRESTCKLLLQVVTQRFDIQDGHTDSLRCSTIAFEAFAFLHGLLLLQLTTLVLLYPVLFRLWWIHSSVRQDHTPRSTVLLQEDEVARLSVYRKL